MFKFVACFWVLFFVYLIKNVENQLFLEEDDQLMEPQMNSALISPAVNIADAQKQVDSLMSALASLNTGDIKPEYGAYLLQTLLSKIQNLNNMVDQQKITLGSGFSGNYGGQQFGQEITEASC